MHVSLKEALCGTTRYIETLEMHEGKAKVLKIETVPGEVLKHGELKVIPNEGFPHYKNPLEKGNMIVNIIVDFPEPKALTETTMTQLAKALTAKPSCIITDDAQMFDVKPFTPKPKPTRQQQGGMFHPFFGHMHAAGAEDDEEDEEEGEGQGQTAACQQQ